MAHVKGVDRWEEGTPTPIPSGAKVRAHSGGEISDPLFTTVYVDAYLLIRVQHSDDDKTTLFTSAPSLRITCAYSDRGRKGCRPFSPRRIVRAWTPRLTR